MNPTPLHPNPEEKPTAATFANPNSLPSSRKLAPRAPDPTEAMAASLVAPLPVPMSVPSYTSLPPYPHHLNLNLTLPPIPPRLQPPTHPGPSMNQPASPTSSYSSNTSFSRTPHLYKKNELPPPRSLASDFNRPPPPHRDLDDHSDSSVRSHGVKRTYDMYAAIRPPPIPTIYPKPPPHSLQTPRYSDPPSPIHLSGSSVASSTTISLTSLIHPPPPAIAMPDSRFTLHLRQNPRAARAGPDGKDRRTIDPPPVLQLLIDDFDPQKDRDLAYLKAHDWVVHAKLISAEAPHEDMSTVATHPERGNNSKVTRLLLGTTVASPFFCVDDPDTENAPEHPTTIIEPPPSPTSEILKIPNRNRGSSHRRPDAYKTFPGAFFIFPDLSIRKAGQYRLEFRLMKMTPDVLIPGRIVPTISIAVSDVFNVVNAKDFDQVQPSTHLVKGLLDRGAGFPLKLKKGLREGQRKKGRSGDGDSDDDDGDGDGDNDGDGRDDVMIEVDDNENEDD